MEDLYEEVEEVTELKKEPKEEQKEKEDRHAAPMVAKDHSAGLYVEDHAVIPPSPQLPPDIIYTFSHNFKRHVYHGAHLLECYKDAMTFG